MATKETERAAYETVDIDNLSVEEELDSFGEKFDPSEDAYDTAKPIPEKKTGYKFKLTIPDEDFCQQITFEAKNGNTVTNLKCNIVCEVVNECPEQGSMIFADVSTAIQRGKNTCTMATLLRKLYGWLNIKATVPNTKSALVAALRDVLLKEPIIPALIVWKAWDSEARDGNGAFAKVGMENFPKMANGEYNHIVKGKSGTEIVAKAKIKRFLSKEEYALIAKGAGNVVSAPKSAMGKPTTSKPTAGKPVAGKRAVNKPVPPPEPEPDVEEEAEEEIDYSAE